MKTAGFLPGFAAVVVGSGFVAVVIGWSAEYRTARGPTSISRVDLVESMPRS